MSIFLTYQFTSIYSIDVPSWKCELFWMQIMNTKLTVLRWKVQDVYSSDGNYFLIFSHFKSHIKKLFTILFTHNAIVKIDVGHGYIFYTYEFMQQTSAYHHVLWTIGDSSTSGSSIIVKLRDGFWTSRNHFQKCYQDW